MNDVILILAVTIPTIAIGFWWVTRSESPPAKNTGPVIELPVILYRDGVIEHASESALRLFPIAIGAHSWIDIKEILAPDYPEFPSHPLPKGSRVQIIDGLVGQLEMERHDNAISLTFHGLDLSSAPTSSSDKLEVLQQVSDSLPYPVWKTDSVGSMVWHNSKYSDLHRQITYGSESLAEKIFNLPQPHSPPKETRIKLDLTSEAEPEWYSVIHCALEDGTIYHAMPLDELVKTEDAQRDFVQTLAKTFAQLSTGLAIFNRDRQLALFNPALVALTGLSVSFLSPRPTIDSFFDALRENRRMPEPKNYKTWRHRMADLISAAEIGQFEETWSLETGQTYRVTGRPHPDGAIAFLLEDISTEVLLTRNFRAELEMGQSLVDTFDDALAVFSRAGVLTFSNKAYDVLWGSKGDSSFADVTIADAIKLWQEKSEPNELWVTLQQSITTLGERDAWEMQVSLKSQKPMLCRIVPIASGATVVRFSQGPSKNLAFEDISGALER